MIEALLLLWQAGQSDYPGESNSRRSLDEPALLVIATSNAVKTIPYRTMRACLRAANAAQQPLAQTGGVRPVISVPTAQFSCIPRN